MTTVLVAFLTNLQAQDTTKMLIHFKRPSYLGLYVAPEFQYGQLSGGYTSMGGSSVMLLINKRFAIGATAQSSLDNNFSPTNLAPLYARTTFGGLKMEYTAAPNSAVHVSFPLVVGMGVVSADSVTNRGGQGRKDGFEGRNGGFSNNGNTFIVVQPGIMLEANVFRFAKVFAGANYRLAFKQEVNNAKISNDALQGLSMSAGLKLGLFDVKIRPKRERRS